MTHFGQSIFFRIGAAALLMLSFNVIGSEEEKPVERTYVAAPAAPAMNSLRLTLRMISVL